MIYRIIIINKKKKKQAWFVLLRSDAVLRYISFAPNGSVENKFLDYLVFFFFTIGYYTTEADGLKPARVTCF